MIFELGEMCINDECPFCHTKHFYVQIGEERVICRCGALLSFANANDGRWLAAWQDITNDIRQGIERFINDDTRNMC